MKYRTADSTSPSDPASTPASFFNVRVQQFSRDLVYTLTFAVAPDYGTNLDRALPEKCGFVARDRIWECWPNEYLGAADA